MTEFTATSGAKIVIGVADWQDAMALKNSIAKEMAATGAEIAEDFDVTALLPSLLAIDSSPAVYAAMFKCLARCSYNGNKITESTFEDVNARQDYYDIVIACGKENLSPFFKSLASMFKKFKTSAPQKPESQK